MRKLDSTCEVSEAVAKKMAAAHAIWVSENEGLGWLGQPKVRTMSMPEYRVMAVAAMREYRKRTFKRD